MLLYPRRVLLARCQQGWVTLVRMRHRLVSLVLFVCVTTVLGSIAPPTPRVQAAGFTVNSTTDAVDATPGDGTCATAIGECTLRAAVMEANALGGAHTINLPAGTYFITIPRSLSSNDDSTGDLDIRSLEITIAGASATSTVIDGSLTDRVFRGQTPSSLHLQSLTIQNGHAANGEDGGAVPPQSGRVAALG